MIKTLALNACKEVVRSACAFGGEKTYSVLGHHVYVRICSLGITAGLVNPRGNENDPYYTYGFGVSPGEVFLLDKQGEIAFHYGECYPVRWAFQKNPEDSLDGRVTL